MADFNAAIPIILQHEGGYVNNPRDPGGETKYGICKRDHPDLDIKNLTQQQATDIYHRDYWRYDPINDQEVATKVFDLAVMCSPYRAHVLLQQAVCACGHVIQIDGRLGPATFAATNAIPPDELLTNLKEDARVYFYKLVQKNPRLEEFLPGWVTRVMS